MQNDAIEHVAGLPYKEGHLTVEDVIEIGNLAKKMSDFLDNGTLPSLQNVLSQADYQAFTGGGNLSFGERCDILADLLEKLSIAVNIVGENTESEDLYGNAVFITRQVKQRFIEVAIKNNLQEDPEIIIGRGGENVILLDFAESRELSYSGYLANEKRNILAPDAAIAPAKVQRLQEIKEELQH